MTDDNDYDLIMDEYESLESDDSPAAHNFVDTELTQMMQTLIHHTPGYENLVIQNKIILLLSLFRKKNSLLNINPTIKLSDKEKLSVKTLAKFLL